MKNIRQIPLSYITSYEYSNTAYLPLETFTPKSRKIIEHLFRYMDLIKLQRIMMSTTEADVLISVKTKSGEIVEFLDCLGTPYYYKYVQVFASGELFLPLNTAFFKEKEKIPNQLEMEQMLSRWLNYTKKELKNDAECGAIFCPNITLKDLNILKDWFSDKKKTLRKYNPDDLDELIGHELDPLKSIELTTALSDHTRTLDFLPTIKKVGGNTMNGYREDIRNILKKINEIHMNCEPHTQAYSNTN